VVPEYPRDLLDRSVAAAIDGIGGALLDAAEEAQGRLADPTDLEALHDFRVALRRLRSVERAFRGRLGDPMAKRLRRLVRDLARATNGARDAEVQLAWIEGQRGDLDGELQCGSTWFVKRLEERRDREYEASIRAIDAEFADVDHGVRAWLQAGRAAEAPQGATFATALGELIEEHVEAVEEKLAAIHVPEDETAVHQARIAAKRLRYLLELVAVEIGVAMEAVTRLKGLQDVLGELHDLQVLDHEFTVALDKEIEPAERRDAAPGVLALARAGREAQAGLYQAFETEWRNGGLAGLRRELDAVLDVLRTHSTGAPVEVNRREDPAT
jgi:CHAD domain-containing protein